MKNTTLVIMAAGVGSRFGKGVKQLAPVGPGGEIIMDYSVYDAVKAGFNRVIFIIRKELEEEFRKGIGSRIGQMVQVDYAFQERTDLPEGFVCPPERTKPWGTGQAVLSCRELLREPFAVINADDYYGREAFQKVHDFLIGEQEDGEVQKICMAGFILGNTLSDNGAVTRGICVLDAAGRLQGINETRNIVKTPEGAGVAEPDGGIRPLDGKSLVSMNMWGLTPAFMADLQDGFVDFLKNLPEEDLTREYLLPEMVDVLLKKRRVQVEVLKSRDNWFGVTYQEDRQAVADAIAELIKQGIYPEKLY